MNEPAEKILGLDRKWWVAATVLPSSVLMGLSSTIVEVPDPIVIAEIDSDRWRYQWVTGLTLIGLVIGMAMLRWLRDRFGLKASYLGGLVVFVGSSLFCGWATGTTAMAAARFVQGLGKGVVLANLLATLWNEFPLRKDLGMALYGVGIYFGKAVAPTLGGWVSDFPSWRWTFFINVPVGVPTLLLSWLVLRPTPSVAAAKRRPFDFLGLGLLILWVAPMTVCLYRGHYWGLASSNLFLLMLGCFVLFLLFFIAWELVAGGPLIDLHLFRRRIFTLSVCIKSLFVANLYGVLALVSGYMVELRQYPWNTSGWVLLPGALAMGFSLIVSALLADRWDRKSRLLWGMAGMALATWRMGAVDLFYDKHWLAVDFFWWGLAAGLVVSPVICLPLEGLTPEEIASSASIKNMVRVLPGTIGGSLVGTLLTVKSESYFDGMRQHVMYNLAARDETARQLGDFMGLRGSAGVSLHEQIEEVIGKYVRDMATGFAYRTGLHWLALIAALGVVLVLFIPSAKPRTQARE